jgi:hypothetical protein
MVRKYGNSLGQKPPRKKPLPPTHQCQFMQANEVAKETTKMAHNNVTNYKISVTNYPLPNYKFSGLPLKPKKP